LNQSILSEEKVTKRIDWDLILKHLEGTSNHEEEKQLQEWLSIRPENGKTLADITKIWETPDRPLPQPDLDSAWQKCNERAGIREMSSKHLSNRRVGVDPVQFLAQLLGSKILKYAAVILIVILTPFLISRVIKSEKWKEIKVPNAQKMIVILSDDTKVTLDAGSSLRYPEKFNNQKRQVYLKGEGYFEVTHIPEKPFILHADGAIITVLGTRFNVRAWNTNPEDAVAVTVAEGKVSLRPERMKDQDAMVIISKGQYCELIGNKYPSVPRFVDLDKHLSWLHREMYFQNVPLTEVLDQLERWYDVEIILSDRSLAANRVTFFLENKPLKDVLEVLSLINDVRFEQDGRKIILSKSN
jgi:transmembrane sensor